MDNPVRDLFEVNDRFHLLLYRSLISVILYLFIIIFNQSGIVIWVQ